MANASVTTTDLKPLSDLIDPAYPVRLREVTEYLFIELIQDDDLREFEHHKLAQLAINQTQRLCHEMGGVNFYLMKGTSYKASQRDLELWERFNGRNYVELAREFGLSEIRIRQIVDDMREKFIAKNQGELDL